MEKSKGTTYLSLCIILLLVDFFVFFRFAVTDYIFVYATILFLAAIIMSFLSRAKNFLLIISVILVTGFVLGFLAKTDLVSQTYLIGEYILFMGALLFMWLLFSKVEINDSERETLAKRVAVLEKHVGSSKLLSNSEFINRVKIISTATKRRNENNGFVILTVNHVNHATESLSFLLEKNLLNTIRSDFDLVTQLENEVFFVFLQNIKEAGSEIVAERLFQALRKEMNTTEIPITYKSMEEEEGLEYFEKNRVGGAA